MALHVERGDELVAMAGGSVGKSRAAGEFQADAGEMASGRCHRGLLVRAAVRGATAFRETSLTFGQRPTLISLKWTNYPISLNPPLRSLPVPLDRVFRNARLPGRSDTVDVAVADGRIAEIAPSIVCDAPAFDAGGRLLSAGLVETHIHLDKAGIIGRCRLCAGTLAEAVAETARAKAAFTVEDVAERASAVVEQAILAGTTRMRSFVEIDPRAGFRSFEALKAVRERYRAAIAIELCAFAQEGLTQEPETLAMLETALRDGADLVGGCPIPTPIRPPTCASSSTSPSVMASPSTSTSISTSTPPAPTCQR